MRPAIACPLLCAAALSSAVLGLPASVSRGMRKPSMMMPSALAMSSTFCRPSPDLSMMRHRLEMTSRCSLMIWSRTAIWNLSSCSRTACSLKVEMRLRKLALELELTSVSMRPCSSFLAPSLATISALNLVSSRSLSRMAAWMSDRLSRASAMSLTPPCPASRNSSSCRSSYLLNRLASSISNSAFCRLMRSSMFSFMSCTRLSMRPSTSSVGAAPPLMLPATGPVTTSLSDSWDLRSCTSCCSVSMMRW
mmetsp:Transcript_25999/g.66152  ORF Transcript_25999/g.66152 Transcript_25999/m.66152 type:complete len:250 (-) Transcript_25999:1337-2086(-)